MHFKKENMLKPEVSKMHLDDKLSQIDIFVCKYLNSNIYPNFLYKDIEFFFYSWYHKKKKIQFIAEFYSDFILLKITNYLLIFIGIR